MTSLHSYEHALLDIRRKLHDQRGSKAALLVGAGFSRNAITRSGNAKPFPLWDELSRQMAVRLYPEKRDRDRLLERSGATSVALRLAQEFEVAFGRSTLIEFVRDAIREDDFVPGKLHAELLELRWSDVFTTNYDRLLETAARRLRKRRYEPVLTLADLPIARRPRIIKLHGSLPDLCQMVLTEDDYRRYPRDFAPFVTTVQAALTENILCLIGFSGDDPNFLAWTGWLRDEFRTSIPKTYLFTGNDDLKPFQRRLYEERHIIPIPVMEMAGVDSYAMAFQWLVSELDQPPGEKLTRWNVGPRYTSWSDERIASEPSRPDVTEQTWCEAAIIWRRHRKLYRNWCVIHREGSERLYSETEKWISEATRTTFKDWAVEAALFALYELVWRHTTSLLPLPDTIVFNTIDPVLQSYEAKAGKSDCDTIQIRGTINTLEVSASDINEAYCFLLRESLRHSREIARDDRFREIRERLERAKLLPGCDRNDLEAFLTHECVLRATSRLKHKEARTLLESWDTSRCDVIWSIRRAGLCLECGLHAIAIDLLKRLLEDLRSSAISDQYECRQLSAEGLVLRLLSNAEWAESNSLTVDDHASQQIVDRLNDIRQHGCDPEVMRGYLELALGAEPRRTNGTFRTDGFMIGTVDRHSSFRIENQLVAAYQAVRFIEDAGLPLRIPHPGKKGLSVTVAEKLFASAIKTITFFAPHEACGLVLRCRKSEVYRTTFGRECLVRLKYEQIETLFCAAERAMSQAMEELSLHTNDAAFWYEQLEVSCIAIGRLVVRLTDERIMQFAENLVDLPHSTPLLSLPNELDRTGRPVCRKALTECVRQTLECLRITSVERILPKTLSAPVPMEPGFPHHASLTGEWADPVDVVLSFRWPKRSAFVKELCRSIDDVINRLKVASGISREHLCLRLVHVYEAGLLTQYQKKSFVAALYDQRDAFGFPTQTGCHDSLILSLPAFRGFNESEAFRKKYLEQAELGEVGWHCLSSTANVSREDSRRSVRWTHSDLQRMLYLADIAIKDVESQHPAGQLRSSVIGESLLESKDRKLEEVGSCLMRCILLNSQSGSRLRSRANALFCRLEAAGLCTVSASPSRAYASVLSVEDAVNDILAALNAREFKLVRQGCTAIDVWRHLAKSRQFAFPQSLLDLIISIIQVRRHEYLPAVINTAGRLLEFSVFESAEDFFHKVKPALTALLAETRYGNEDGPAQHSGFSMGARLGIRTACIRLTRKVSECGVIDRILDEWSNEIAADSFADVRRVADEWK